MPASEQSPSADWLREPLLHFILLAGLLFAIDYWATRTQRDQIVVSQQTVDFLVQQREDLELRILLPEERAETVDQFVVDEILYAEAYKRGLDRNDSRMRRNLIRKMRGLLAGEIEQPSEEQLQQWYEENADRFTAPESRSLTHVFFDSGDAVPDDLLTRLNDGLDPASVGDNRIDFGRRLPRMTKRQLAGMLGPENAQAVISITDDKWHGPYESAIGFHFLRVTGHNPARVQTLAQVQPYLTGEWLMAQTRQRIDAEVGRLRADYEVIIENAEPDN